MSIPADTHIESATQGCYCGMGGTRDECYMLLQQACSGAPFMRAPCRPSVAATWHMPAELLFLVLLLLAGDAPLCLAAVTPRHNLAGRGDATKNSGASLFPGSEETSRVSQEQQGQVTGSSPTDVVVPGSSGNEGTGRPYQHGSSGGSSSGIGSGGKGRSSGGQRPPEEEHTNFQRQQQDAESSGQRPLGDEHPSLQRQQDAESGGEHRGTAHMTSSAPLNARNLQQFGLSCDNCSDCGFYACR